MGIAQRFRAPPAGPAKRIAAETCDDIVARAARSIRALLPDHGAVLTGVAKAMAMSPRSLQRRLRLAGVSFSDLLSAARLDLARKAVASGHNATQLAPIIGLSEGSAVSRFLRHEGLAFRALRSEIMTALNPEIDADPTSRRQDGRKKGSRRAAPDGHDSRTSSSEPLLEIDGAFYALTHALDVQRRIEDLVLRIETQEKLISRLLPAGGRSSVVALDSLRMMKATLKSLRRYVETLDRDIARLRGI